MTEIFIFGGGSGGFLLDAFLTAPHDKLGICPKAFGRQVFGGQGMVGYAQGWDGFLSDTS